jgi:hypothetical protein
MVLLALERMSMTMGASMHRVPWMNGCGLTTWSCCESVQRSMIHCAVVLPLPPPLLLMLMLG